MTHEQDRLMLVNGNGRSLLTHLSGCANLWREAVLGAGGSSSDSEFAVNEGEEILLSLARAVEQRDRHTAGHCERLAWIGVALGAAMGLSRANLGALYRGGYLHDVGKVGIPDKILFKPGELTADEWAVMRTHPARGEEICRPMKSLASVLPIIRHHHERWNGTGYPDGLRGQQIPLVARVLQLADIYDALTSPRPYKSAFSEAKALQIIETETGNGWRDPEVVEVFLRVHCETITRMPDVIGEIPGSLANLRQMVSAPTECDVS